LTLLKYFPPLVLNVPVRITKGGSKIETHTEMFRREFSIKTTTELAGEYLVLLGPPHRASARGAPTPTTYYPLPTAYCLTTHRPLPQETKPPQ